MFVKINWMYGIGDSFDFNILILYHYKKTILIEIWFEENILLLFFRKEYLINYYFFKWNYIYFLMHRLLQLDILYKKGILYILKKLFNNSKRYKEN